MALFDFECDQCGHRVERIQKHTDPPPVCSPCDEMFPPETPYMRRKIGRSSFVLKGGGWAADGYARKE